MGFWNDLAEFVRDAADNPAEAMSELRDGFAELGDILSDSGKQLGEIASDAFMVLTPMVRGPYQLFMKENVRPLRGSVLCCHLGLVLDHSGIYIGKGKIVHMNGNCGIEVVDDTAFLARFDGYNPALTIWCACRGDKPVCSEEIAARAEKALHDDRWKKYDSTSNNCHKFTQYCVAGRLGTDTFDFTFSNLCDVVSAELDANSWRVAGF